MADEPRAVNPAPGRKTETPVSRRVPVSAQEQARRQAWGARYKPVMQEIGRQVREGK